MKSTGRIAIAKDHIINDMKKIGVAKGDHLAVNLSFKSIGYFIGGPEAFIDALLAAVGSEGTIMMNTYTMSFGIAVIPSDYVFDNAKTGPYTGLVPRTLIKRKDSIRSLHPTCSVASIGKMAKYLTNGHDETATPFLPYEKLAQIGGKYLALGIGDRLVAIRHEAQRRAGLYVVPHYWGVKFKNSEGKIKQYIESRPPCPKKLPELVPKLESIGVVRRGKIGMANSVIGSADKLIDVMSAMLKENPTLNLCDDLFGYKCRETERRMNLYGKIVNPKFSQKNTLIKTVLSWRNRLLLRRLNYCDWRKIPNWLKQILRVVGIFQRFLNRHLT
jgi:aminoglycoside 3-N-acetyltransferase